jgi:hypothetical protein
MGEIWRDIEGFEGAYQVSNFGRVRRICERYDSIKTDKGLNRILREKRAGRDYKSVCLTWKKRREYRFIHRLVATAFLDNPEGLPQVNHKNADKSDNRVDNLEWMTASDNHRHASESGIAYRGSLNGAAILTAENVLEARRLNKAGITRKELADRYGVAYDTMSDAIAGRTWGWL